MKDDARYYHARRAQHYAEQAECAFENGSAPRCRTLAALAQASAAAALALVAVHDDDKEGST